MKAISDRLPVDEWLFFIAWALFLSTLILMGAIFYVNNDKLEKILKLVRYVAYGLCAIKIIRHRYERKEILFLALLTLAFFIAGVGTGNLTYPLYSFIVLAALDMDNTKIVKATAWIQGVYLFGIVLLSRIGLILDYVFEPTTRLRHGLGFSWTTTPSIMFFYFCLCVVYINHKKLSFWVICLLEIIAVYFLIMTDSKMAFLMTTGFLLFITIQNLNRKKWKWLSHFNVIYIVFPFLMLALTLVVSKIYDWYVPAWAAADKFMSYRLGLSQNALNKYGIHLLGQPIHWVGYDYKAIISGQQEAYNYVDSSYLQLMFNNGLVFLVSVLCMYSYGIYKAINHNDYYLVVIYLFVLVIALTEPRLMNFAYNPFPLLAIGQMASGFYSLKKPVKRKIVFRK